MENPVWYSILFPIGFTCFQRELNRFPVCSKHNFRLNFKHYENCLPQGFLIYKESKFKYDEILTILFENCFLYTDMIIFAKILFMTVNMSPDRWSTPITNVLIFLFFKHNYPTESIISILFNDLTFVLSFSSQWMFLSWKWKVTINISNSRW